MKRENLQAENEDLNGDSCKNRETVTMPEVRE